MSEATAVCSELYPTHTQLPMQLRILVGTVTKTAERAAQAMLLECGDRVNSVEVLMMDGLDIKVFDEEALYVICTSTTGAGDVPENAHLLYHSLSAEPRYLGSVRYGVFALGDSVYPDTFCNGGLRFDERLADLGAVRLGEIHRHDASAGIEAEEEAAAWCRQWLISVALPSTPLPSAAGSEPG